MITWVCLKCAREMQKGFDDGAIPEHHRTCPKRVNDSEALITELRIAAIDDGFTALDRLDLYRRAATALEADATLFASLIEQRRQAFDERDALAGKIAAALEYTSHWSLRARRHITRILSDEGTPNE